MSIEKLVNELETAINSTYNTYISLHEELDVHRGKPLTETNLDEVNRILKEIQEVFSELYPAYHFITHRNQYAINAINTYNEFIEVLKKAGAAEHKPQNTES